MTRRLVVAFLLLTVVLLAVVVATGLQARRRVHLTMVALMVTSLCVTIFFAERLGARVVFDGRNLYDPGRMAKREQVLEEPRFVGRQETPPPCRGTDTQPSRRRYSGAVAWGRSGSLRLGSTDGK